MPAYDYEMGIGDHSGRGDEAGGCSKVRAAKKGTVQALRMVHERNEAGMKNKVQGIDMYRTGQNIKKIMRMRGLKVRDVQEYLGLAAPQSVYHWFDGRALPSVDNLYLLSELFHVPMDMLICGGRREEFGLCSHPECRRVVKYYKKCGNMLKAS